MIRHQIVYDDELTRDFKEYTEKVLELKGVPQETKLEFYAYYKQATVGPCNVDKPGMFDFRGQAKHHAWKELGDLSQNDAMLMYIDLFNSIDQSLLKEGDDDDGGQNLQMSTLFKADDVDLPSHEKDVWHACRKGDTKMFKACFMPALANEKDEEKRTFLHWSVDRNHPELVEWLLEQGCDIDAQDEDGSTALHYACTCDYTQIVKQLLSANAKTDVVDGEGLTAKECTESAEIMQCFDIMKLS